MSTDPLVQRLRALIWPTPVNDQPDPEPGQLWRATWEGVTSLVVIAAPVGGRTVDVFAASAASIGDNTAFIADTAHGLRPTVWASITDNVKLFTLEHRISDLTAAAQATLSVVAAGNQPGEWAPISNILDDRSLARAELLESLHALATAEWLPDAQPTANSLDEQAAAAGFQRSQVADALGITPGDARRLMTGKRAPTDQELTILAELLGAEPSVAVTLDDELVAGLDRPEFRPHLLAMASDRFEDNEIAARRSFAGEMFALAARHREPGPRNWVALIRDELRED